MRKIGFMVSLVNDLKTASPLTNTLPNSIQSCFRNSLRSYLEPMRLASRVQLNPANGFARLTLAVDSLLGCILQLPQEKLVDSLRMIDGNWRTSYMLLFGVIPWQPQKKRFQRPLCPCRSTAMNGADSFSNFQRKCLTEASSGCRSFSGASHLLLRSHPAQELLLLPCTTPSGLTMGTSTTLQFSSRYSPSLVLVFSSASITPSIMREDTVSQGCVLAITTSSGLPFLPRTTASTSFPAIDLPIVVTFICPNVVWRSVKVQGQQQAKQIYYWQGAYLVVRVLAGVFEVQRVQWTPRVDDAVGEVVQVGARAMPAYSFRLKELFRIDTHFHPLAKQTVRLPHIHNVEGQGLVLVIRSSRQTKVEPLIVARCVGVVLQQQQIGRF